jgi:hypothetical protein
VAYRRICNLARGSDIFQAPCYCPGKTAASPAPGISRLCPAQLSDMTDNFDPFAEFALEHGIDLRWILRDIKAKWLKMSPVSDDDLRLLIELGLVEMREGAPVPTLVGHDALDTSS